VWCYYIKVELCFGDSMWFAVSDFVMCSCVIVWISNYGKLHIFFIAVLLFFAYIELKFSAFHYDEGSSQGKHTISLVSLILDLKYFSPPP